MLNIIRHSSLPFDEVRTASNLETKKEVKLLTGKKIHCLKLDNTLYVSDELYQNFKAE